MSVLCWFGVLYWFGVASVAWRVAGLAWSRVGMKRHQRSPARTQAPTNTA